MGAKDHKRGEKITFHNMGVAGHGDRFKEAKEKGWKMKTFAEIMEYLGHSDVGRIRIYTQPHKKRTSKILSIIFFVLF